MTDDQASYGDQAGYGDQASYGDQRKNLLILRAPAGRARCSRGALEVGSAEADLGLRAPIGSSKWVPNNGLVSLASPNRFGARDFAACAKPTFDSGAPQKSIPRRCRGAPGAPSRWALPRRI